MTVTINFLNKILCPTNLVEIIYSIKSEHMFAFYIAVNIMILTGDGHYGVAGRKHL